MIVKKTYEIKSCDDVELDIKRSSKLKFYLYYDETKPVEALVFVIQGIGADADDSFLELVIKSLLKDFCVAFVSVNYHCIGNRPQTGSKFYLDDIDKLIMQASLEALNLKLPFNIKELNSYDDMSSAFKLINNKIIDLKKEGELEMSFYLNLHVSLAPARNEYQNFGIMAASDLINTALYLQKNAPFSVGGGALPVIMTGGSYGAYLALLSAKLAPWLIDGVIENSGGAKILQRLVGFGKELDFMKEAEFASFDFFHHIKTHCSSKTFWSSNKYSKNYFSKARLDIRTLLVEDHLKTQTKFNQTKIIGYHSAKDEYLSYQDKQRLFELYKELGFKAYLRLIKDESEVDGKFIKNLKHGLGIPLKLLLKKELPIMLDLIKKAPKKEYKEKSISYKSAELIYTFFQKYDKLNLKITNG
ncbi:hypothetical protein DMB92_02810 [Campylobacter sp. MIT 99-7217]|uniref:DUF2920 family protein n=1 Tax=Campylobacter sp. MIT 99-7217 TaxID=535091 RepID=UPI001158EEAF|nr:DUF2920 family protein [Campylobacter sp. MIT 99-7217]TQR33829.1 hypothetical protein DMB92_02810 [Campylobacter sp. MIT 99-7217]